MGLGRNSVIKLDDSSGSLQTITTYVKKFNLGETEDSGDVTTMGSKSTGRIPGLQDVEFSGEGIYVKEFHRILNEALCKSRTLQVSQLGTGTGAVQYSGEAIVTEYEVEINFDAENTISFGGAGNGTLTRGSN